MNKLVFLWLLFPAAFTSACSRTEAPVAPAVEQVIERQPESAPHISGVVTLADGTTPAVSARVSVYRIDEEFAGFGEPGPVHYRNRGLFMPGRAGSWGPLRSEWVDGFGRFEFTVEPGEYIVHAELGAFVCGEVEPFTITFGDELEPLEIRMPPTGLLVGKIENEDGALLERMVGIVRPIDDDALVYGIGDLPTFELAADGSFGTGPLLAVPSRVTLYRVGPSRSGARSGIGIAHLRGASIELGVVEVIADEVTHATFRAEQPWWALVELELQVNGEPASGYTVHFLPDGQTASWATCVTDTLGSSSLKELTPGTYRVVIQAPDNAWMVALPARVHHDTHKARDLEFSVRTSRARVRLVDATSQQPLANALFWLNPPLGMAQDSKARTTDAEGWVELELPSGTFSVSGLLNAPQPDSPRFEGPLRWTATDEEDFIVEVSLSE